MVGSVDGITRITMPTLPCWMKALTRKRPMPRGMAKLHSLVRSNSAACLSFMTERASVSVWLLRQRLRAILGDLAVDLDGRRKVGRDEQVAAVAADQQAQQVVDEFGGLIAFHVVQSVGSWGRHHFARSDGH
jgi:hypothetical protein